MAAGDGALAAEGAGFDEEIEVVAPTPGGTARIALDRLPFNVQTTDADALERSQSLDLTDYLSTHFGSVSLNSAQSNPLQPDIQYRGYTASPLLGLPMGIAVYQNGARINEPLGDAVNWDLLPESAVHSMTLIGGANPLFGLNTLGGAPVDRDEGRIQLRRTPGGGDGRFLGTHRDHRGERGKQRQLGLLRQRPLFRRGGLA